QPSFWTRYRLLTLSLVLLFLVAFQLCMLIAPPGQREPYAWLLVPALVALVCFGLSVASRSSTAGRLRAFLGTPRRYKVFDETYPTYRFVDLCRALEHLAAASARAQALEHICPRYNLQGVLRDY